MRGGLPEVAGVEHRFVELAAADGPVRVHLAEAGAGEPLLLLHGWPQHWYMWRRVVPLLAERFRLLIPDLRGFGWSTAPGRGYEAPAFAADALALLDALGIERASLVGHDWGGFSAFIAALEHPERVERIVVINAPHPWPRRNLRTLAELWRTWYVVLNALPGPTSRALASPRLMRRFLAAGGRDEVFEEEAVRSYAERLATPAGAALTRSLYRHYLRTAAAVLAGVDRYRDRRLEVPGLLLFGTEDRYVSAALIADGDRHGDQLAVELVPGCGHFLAEERPDLVARRVLAFCA